ncbi:unnamed protein product [Symbiodinium natans]|uniref:Uncharacterized protein n=1 Tax=Symbiodinium natans TaxID=878477 RepID=A0A812PZ55_9DINO|nr:unnamed protein product [Symbiodinium natans]
MALAAAIGLSLACAVYQCCAKPILDEQDFKNKKRKMEARKAAGKKNCMQLAGCSGNFQSHMQLPASVVLSGNKLWRFPSFFLSTVGPQQLAVPVLRIRVQLPKAIDGCWRRPFRQMTFNEDSSVELPELQQEVRLIQNDANRLRAELQELACFAGIGMKFQEARSQALVRVSLAGNGLQYTVDGLWRPPFQQLEFRDDDLVMFPEIHHTAQLPKSESSSIRSMLQVLAAEVGFGVSFVEARGKGCVRMTLASHGRLQYTVDGACRPPFFKMHFEDSFVHFPELGTTAKLPEASAELRAQLQDLAVAASAGVQFKDDAARPARRVVRIICADDRLLQCSVDGDVKPTFQQMTFMPDGYVDFPELGQSFQLPQGQEHVMRTQLQELACKAHLGVRLPGRSDRLVRFHLGPQHLQYTVDGSWRAPIQQIRFSEDGLMAFPQLEKTVRVPEEDADAVRIVLQELANLAGLGACFEEPRTRSSIRVSIAGDGLLQYSMNGSWRPCFREMRFREAS